MAMEKEQWSRFINLCGNWHGTWHRYAVDPAGVPKEDQCSRGVCFLKVSEDQSAVHHRNSYELGTQPASPHEGATTEEGLHEVDFGNYNPWKSQHPLGPHTRAVYLDGGAAISSSNLVGSPMIGAEFALMEATAAGRRRRRMVILWKRAEGAPESVLSQMYEIVEQEEEEGKLLDRKTDDAPPTKLDLGDLREWHGVSTTTDIEGFTTEKVSHDPGSITLTDPDDVLPAGVYAWIPRVYRDDMAQFSIAMGWKQDDNNFSRVEAVFSRGSFTHAVHSVFQRRT